MVCKNCGYNNRDGVGFCRHCGILLKEKSRRSARVKAAKKAKRYEDSREPSLSPPDGAISPDAKEETIPGRGKNFRSATIAIGIFVIACFAAFCIFAFDLLIFPGSGGSITVDSSAAASETPGPKLTPSPTPVPTVATSPADDYGSLFVVPAD